MPINNSDTTSQHLILRITIWAEMQARVVLETGRPLDQHGIQMAIRAGVQHPEEVLLLIVSKVPTSEDADLRQILERFSIVTPSTRGLTIGYNVFLRRDSVSDARLAHQLKRIAQFENCQGIPGFFEKYTSEVNKHGCARAPLEVEAAEFARNGFLER